MKKELVNIRRNYVDEIKKDLLGPGSECLIGDIEHEIISSNPKDRYSIGVLYPQNQTIGADNDEVAETSDNEDELFLADESEKDVVSTNTKVNHHEYADAEIDVDEYTNSEDNMDEDIGLALQNMPSSMGITFFAKGISDKVRCSVSFATYRKTTQEDWVVSFIPEDADNYKLPLQLQSYYEYDNETKVLKRISKTPKSIKELQEDLEKNGFVDTDNIIGKLYDLNNIKSGFVRVPHKVDLELDFSSADYIDNNSELDGTLAKVTAYRKKIENEVYSVSVMLVNGAESESNDCLFQSKIVVNSDNNEFVFFDYSGSIDYEMLDEEEKSLELLYRNKHIYATGLGVATDWQIDSDGKGMVYSEYFPTKEVPSMSFDLPEDSDINSNVLSMKYLSDLNCSSGKEEKIKLLNMFVNLYEIWINGICESAKQLPEKFKITASKNIDNCKFSLERMKFGIELLQQNSIVWSAFELANRAMFMQRVHIKLPQKLSTPDIYDENKELMELLGIIDYNTVDTIIDDYYAWRPFQLAFLLMSINSIVDDNSVDRELVDLIWFPTGGGKTEAYLGLSAFTIFYRKLAYPSESNGTAIIMRYTLRLLTAQQFTRASTLICACEYIRNDCNSKQPKYKKYPLGNDEITIGLWIGGEHTPNLNEGKNSAQDFIDKLSHANIHNLNYYKDKYNRFQVLKCPWCSTKMVRDVVDDRIVGSFGYQMSRKHLKFYCPQQDCAFSSKLPIQVVDEELYNNPPTLLFATVDKFAMMPWNEKASAFFGVGTNNRTPELIIQDELHLISGPLGTMVGLYESAIDYLCSSKGHKTKIIASTATIRKAKEQCASLYNRKVLQFPSPGISAEDSFFAKEEKIDYENGKNGRLYVGLMPSGKTKATMEIRSIATLTQSIYNMNLSDDCKDAFWTTTVYFNSLKELGKCTTLVEDDVKDAIRRLGVRKNVRWRRIGIPDELTSRVSTTELNSTLDKLEHIRYKKENEGKPPYPSNVLLATNMISVGIDVSRLNVMLMVGQPKLTSEYIQASSRIGREYPGVAFILYDGGKSRDRSHYEQFKPYHEAFYKFVEPTGATPYSEPARERALHAVVITLLRYLNVSLQSDNEASNFDSEKYSEEINSIKEFIVERYKNIISTTNPEMEVDSKTIIDEIDYVIEKWEALAAEFDDEFYYGYRFLRKHPSSEERRLMKVFDSDSNDDAIRTMSSMRNVDQALEGNVITKWKE